MATTGRGNRQKFIGVCEGAEDDSNWASFGGCSLPLKHNAIRPKAISPRQENTDYDLLYITLFHPTSMRYETGISTIDSITTISSADQPHYICL